MGILLAVHKHLFKLVLHLFVNFKKFKKMEDQQNHALPFFLSKSGYLHRKLITNSTKRFDFRSFSSNK